MSRSSAMRSFSTSASAAALRGSRIAAGAGSAGGAVTTASIAQPPFEARLELSALSPRWSHARRSPRRARAPDSRHPQPLLEIGRRRLGRRQRTDLRPGRQARRPSPIRPRGVDPGSIAALAELEPLRQLLYARGGVRYPTVATRLLQPSGQFLDTRGDSRSTAGARRAPPPTATTPPGRPRLPCLRARPRPHRRVRRLLHVPPAPDHRGDALQLVKRWRRHAGRLGQRRRARIDAGRLELAPEHVDHAQRLLSVPPAPGQRPSRGELADAGDERVDSRIGLAVACGDTGAQLEPLRQLDDRRREILDTPCHLRVDQRPFRQLGHRGGSAASPASSA